jgi:hypothetical protein
MPDESNLFFSTFKEIGRAFDRVHVQSFNMFGYCLKGFPGKLALAVARFANRADRSVATLWPSAPKFGANANVIFWR